MELFYSLPKNILDKIYFIREDFIGFTIDPHVFSIFFTCLIFAMFSMFISYSLGKKILFLFRFRTNTSYNYLVFIALGYIIISSGIAVLGFLSILSPINITLYLISISIYSFLFPFSLKNRLIDFFNSFRNDFTFFKKNKFVFFWTMLFIFIALLNLINPEIREDQYHADLPKMYLTKQTIMIPSMEESHVSASPLLSEMYYTIGLLYFSKESARFVHFIFYILVILTLINYSKLKGFKLAIYTPLLFVSAPVVIHETSSMYVDFQWIFFLLLSVLLLSFTKKLNYSTLGLSGILLGGMLATKLWTIVFFPVAITYLIFILKKYNKQRIINCILIYVAFFSIAPSLWLTRAYLLTGNPLYPAFSNVEDSNKISFFSPLLNFVGINYQLLNTTSFVNVFSPLFFIGCILFLYRFRDNLRLILKMDLFKLFFLLLLLYLSIHYPFGRYLLGLYVFFIFFASAGIDKTIKHFKNSIYLINLLIMVVFSYYFINSILILPYSLGFADKNKYLTRILSRDNSSYFDFNKQFDKHISQKDYVLTYKTYGYYYANFKYVDFNFIFNDKNRIFNTFKKNKITKLFIKGGDINWFCENAKITGCSKTKYQIISMFIGTNLYYLYDIK